MKKINTFLRNRAKYSLFLIAGVVVSFAIVNNTFADDYSLTLTSSGPQSINVSGSSGTAISSDSINVSTTCRYGYNFTINTSVNNNNLYLNGDSSNNASGTYFSPVDGTTALNSSTNKWGYYYNNSASNTPTSTSIFSPVPTLNNPATVKTPLTTPASSNINDNFKIYYGVNSAPEMSVGTYKMIPDTNNSNNDGTIVYTATMAEACIAYTVHFSPSGYFEGNLITGGGTMSDQTIYEGVSTSLANVAFNNPTRIGNVDYYFAGWNTAQDGSGMSYYNTEDVTDLVAAGNSITLYAMWTDCRSNRVCYSANVSNMSEVEGMMGGWGQPVPSSAESVSMYAPNFKRSNYGFVAWNTRPDGSGVNYGPNQRLNFTAGQYSTGGLKLYAQWVESIGNMQNWSDCKNMNIGDVTALKDIRDNDVYAVAKLVDGKCWMIENLRLANKDDDNNDINLSSSNTHNPSLPLTNTYNVDPIQAITSNHLSIPIDPTQTSWCKNNSSACIDQSMVATNNTTIFIDNTLASQTENIYSYGNYYNWYSATAGHGLYNLSSGDVVGDICPLGWRLPTGGSAAADYGNLDVAMGGTGSFQQNNEAVDRWLSYPNNFVKSGWVSDSRIGNRGASSYYWSSSVIDNKTVYSLRIDSDGSIYPGANNVNFLKNNGYAVRCVSSV